MREGISIENAPRLAPQSITTGAQEAAGWTILWPDSVNTQYVSHSEESTPRVAPGEQSALPGGP